MLNADFRPLSYYPLSLWSWQETVKAVFLDRVNIVSEYERFVRSPSFEMRLPSVVSLKTYVKPALYPAFTRFNVFLRDRFSCQYCGCKDDLTFDHLIPRSRGGQTRWDNVVTACEKCNSCKGGRLLHETGMVLRTKPKAPMHPALAKLSEGIADTEATEERKRALPSHLLVCLVIAMSLWSKASMRTVLKNLVDGLSEAWVKKGKYWSVPCKSSITEARQRVGSQVMSRLFHLIVHPLATVETPEAFLGGLG